MRKLSAALRRVLSAMFLFLDRLGFHVLPKHYYSPVADRARLASSLDWRDRIELNGIDWNLNSQADWFKAICESHAEVAEARVDALEQTSGPGFGPIEGYFLYCFVRSQRPKRVLEIGSGVSTTIMLTAASDEDYPISIKIVDPHSPVEPRMGVSVIKRRAQTVDFEELADELRPGDLLFIDSTHAVRTGSEVPRLYLELLPLLPSGVFVHIHDVYLPYLYGPDVLTWPWDWQETTLLTALLVGNERLRVMCGQAALHHDLPDVIKQSFPSYQPAQMKDGVRSGAGQFPASLWLEIDDSI